MAREIGDFITGLEGLTISGVTMQAAKPADPPADDELPLAWVEAPTIIGREPTTLTNSAIRPLNYRAAILLPVAYARKDELDDVRDTLRTHANALQAALDAADIGFRLTYEIALERKIQAGGETFYGIAAVITGV